MKLVTLTWRRINELGENPSCGNLKCGKILFPGEKVYRANGGGPINRYFCQECEENPEPMIYIVIRSGRPRKKEVFE